MPFSTRRTSVHYTERLSDNHKLLYQYIRTRGPLARADLVRISDLTFPSISRMVAELLELGLVQETTQRRGGMGKPPTELVIVPEAACALGLSVAEAKTHAVVIDALGVILETTEVATEAALGASLSRILADLKTPAARLIGVGVTQASDALDDEARDALEQDAGYPVVSSSQAGAGALRERYFGAAQTLDTFLYLNVGETLESAALLGRRLLAPARQLRGLADVLDRDFDSSRASWSASLPTLSTTLRAAEQLLTPEALIVGGDVSDDQLQELTDALAAHPSSAGTPLVKGFSGPDEHALAAATLPLYSTFNVASPVSAPART